MGGIETAVADPVVPGDVVIVNAGDRVPDNIRVIVTALE